jgi:hypothetical protein
MNEQPELTTDPTVEDPALVPTTAPPLGLTTGLIDLDLKRASAAVESRIAFYKGCRDMSVRLTLPADWIDFAGRPYLQASGVERLKALWGIYIRNLRIEPHLDEVRRRLRAGEHVSVQVLALAGSRVTGEESEFVGGRSSDDQFFAAQPGGLQSLDPADLVKAAMSNLEVNAITRLLGLRGLTWEDLKPQGIAKGQAPAVTYREPGPTKGQRETASLARTIRDGLEAVHGGDALQALALLSEFRGRDGGKRSLTSWEQVERASEKYLQILAKKVDAELASWQARGQPAPTVPLQEEPF